MTIFELDDFELWIDSGISEKEAMDSFCSLFFFPIDWAKNKGLLSEELESCNIFQDSYAKVQAGLMSFSDFVITALDGKLLSSYFAKGVQQFVADYAELDGFSQDLSSFFRVNIWEIPSTVDASRKFRGVIDNSYNNYQVNRVKNPEIVSFSEPGNGT